jgi:peptide/nickel transport system ATP-binding protein
VLAAPGHPYTRALIRCLPGLAAPKQPLEQIPGTLPDLFDLPGWLPFFRARCREANERCVAGRRWLP